MIYLQLFLSYLKIGFCSFGGLSMIPVLQNEMVSKGWMSAAQVSDLVGIAEMTPGSLGINCATFAGLQTAGIPGALAAVVGVMMPSLTLCMAAAYLFDKFLNNPRLGHAMEGVRPVCLGMIGAIVFPLCSQNYLVAGAPQWAAILIGTVALILLLGCKMGIVPVIFISAVLGLVLVR